MTSPPCVMVTGATGYISAWVVNLLLQQGYRVHATVRDLSSPRTAQLEAMRDQHGSHLKLFAADLLHPNDFMAPMQGCSQVCHIASPIAIGRIKHPYKTLVLPAVNGTKNVLNAVNKTPSVTRVVITSSVAAISNHQHPDSPLTEADWNHDTLVENAYSYAKTQAEKTAWNMAKAQDHWQLVTLNPSMVIGPTCTQSLRHSLSIQMMYDFLNGKYRLGVPNLSLNWVDVRDVANAHLLALQTEVHPQRIIISAEEAALITISRMLKTLDPQCSGLPKRIIPNWLTILCSPWVIGISRSRMRRNLTHPAQYDNTRSRTQLHLTYRPLETTLHDLAQQFNNAQMPV